MISLLAVLLLAALDEAKLLSPYPGSTGGEPQIKEFDTYGLVVEGTDSAKGQCGKKQQLEGRVVKINYENPEGRTEHEIFANYRDAAKKAGFQTIFTCREEECFADGKPSNSAGDCGDNS